MFRQTAEVIVIIAVAAVIELAVQQRQEAANGDQARTRLYRVADQGKGNNAQVGGRLDLFA